MARIVLFATGGFITGKQRMKAHRHAVHIFPTTSILVFHCLSKADTDASESHALERSNGLAKAFHRAVNRGLVVAAY